MLRVTVQTDAARQHLQAIAAKLTAEAIDKVVDRAAFETQAALIMATPKKWFGQVRRGWIVVKPQPGQRLVANENPIMLFLEEGTRAHGPREFYGPGLLPGQRRKKALFIPLTRRAVNATAGPFETGTVDQFTLKGETYWEQRRALFVRTQSVRGGVVRTGRTTLVYGVDYVLAKRVKGISAMHITANERPQAKARLLLHMKNYLRSLIQNPSAV